MVQIQYFNGVTNRILCVGCPSQYPYSVEEGRGGGVAFGKIVFKFFFKIIITVILLK